MKGKARFEDALQALCRRLKMLCLSVVVKRALESKEKRALIVSKRALSNSKRNFITRRRHALHCTETL